MINNIGPVKIAPIAKPKPIEGGKEKRAKSVRHAQPEAPDKDGKQPGRRGVSIDEHC